MMRIGLILASALSACAVAGQAAVLSEDDITAAANGFLTRDGVGSTILFGRMVRAVEPHGNLWIAHLAPSGYIVLAGSDEAEPVPFFSTNDFSEPEGDSAFAAALGGADDACVKLETKNLVRNSLMLFAASSVTASTESSEEDVSARRKARWEKLLGQRSPMKLMATANALTAGATGNVVVQPFLPAHWNQCQPYNDYAPLYDATATGSYRGRAPCGCVATAAAQAFHYWEWPVRIDEVRTVAHQFAKDGKPNGYEDFPMRFDGRVPLEWGFFDDEYASYWYPDGRKYSYDLRGGGLAESARYPVARLIFLCGSLAGMKYAEEGSGANFSTVRCNSPWYQGGEELQLQDSNRNLAAEPGRTKMLERIRSNMVDRIPVQISIPGHAIVGHGWAEDSSSKYIYVNYGWGGSNDNYYNLDDTTSDDRIEDVAVDFVPRRMVQVDPLPKVCGTSVKLDWHLPWRYEESVTGFAVDVCRQSGQISDFADDFSTTKGVIAPAGIVIDSANSKATSPVLKIGSQVSGTYSYGQCMTLTSRSVLTYDVYSVRALNMTVEIQMRDGDGWTTLSSPVLSGSNTAVPWSTQRVFLGGYGGKSVQFRIKSTYVGGDYYSSCNILIDNLRVSDVFPFVPDDDRCCVAANAEARSCSVNGLEPGSTYSLAVVPMFADGRGEVLKSEIIEVEGSARQPLPGEETFLTQDMIFDPGSSDSAWSVVSEDNDPQYGTESVTVGAWSGGFSVRIDGLLTASSALSFGWSTKGYFGETDCADTLSAIFVDFDNVRHQLWSVMKTANQLQLTTTVDLSAFAGRSGTLTVTFDHSGSQYTLAGNGATFYSPKVTNVMAPALPELAWGHSVARTALGMPRIKSVSTAEGPFAEGFYCEKAFGENTFLVECSESVVSLAATLSHIALISDDEVTVTPLGKGRFAVAIDASHVPERYSRSRMILTLAATDANGTTVCRNLSLRFSLETAVRESVVPEMMPVQAGGMFTLVPVTWMKEMGLVGDGATLEQKRAAAEGDPDGDGQPTWSEFLCGTSPVDATDNLKCLITMVDGKPHLDYTPKTFLGGLRPVFKGTDSLTSGTWEASDTGTHRFFRLVLEP